MELIGAEKSEVKKKEEIEALRRDSRTTLSSQTKSNVKIVAL